MVKICGFTLKAACIGACVLGGLASLLFSTIASGSARILFLVLFASSGFCVGGIAGGLLAVCRHLIEQRATQGQPSEYSIPRKAHLLVRRTLVGLSVIAAFGVALGLSVLVVAHLRQQANMMKCENNLRQIAIALVSHDQTYGVLPLAVAPVLPPGEKYSAKIPPGGPLPGLPVERRLSWQAEILPFVISWPTREHLQFAKPWDEGENLNHVTWVQLGGKGEPLAPPQPNVMSWYQCPNADHPVTPGVPSLTNYIGIAGIGPDAAELPKGDRRAGVFGYDRQIAINEVTNGLNATLTVIESGYANGPWAAGGFATMRAGLREQVLGC